MVNLRDNAPLEWRTLWRWCLDSIWTRSKVLQVPSHPLYERPRQLGPWRMHVPNRLDRESGSVADRPRVQAERTPGNGGQVVDDGDAGTARDQRARGLA